MAYISVTKELPLI